MFIGRDLYTFQRNCSLKILPFNNEIYKIKLGDHIDIDIDIDRVFWNFGSCLSAISISTRRLTTNVLNLIPMYCNDDDDDTEKSYFKVQQYYRRPSYAKSTVHIVLILFFSRHKSLKTIACSVMEKSHHPMFYGTSEKRHSEKFYNVILRLISIYCNELQRLELMICGDYDLPYLQHLDQLR